MGNWVAFALVAFVLAGAAFARPEGSEWEIGRPIVTYWAGPDMTDATAQQMAEGGFNVVWCTENQLDTVAAHGLRAMLHHGLLRPATLDDPEQTAQLDALIERVKGHPALYAYFMTDEPSASRLPELGKLVAHLRQRDPERLAYINLFPTYASNEQLGTTGDVETAYAEHLRLFLEQVKPDLVSYDHYHYGVNGDTGQYFLNLGMIRKAALREGLPFLNIVQACTWSPGMRVPTSREVRFLVYTSLAYGAQGISYYVYCHPGHEGAIAYADGRPTPLYHALSRINREFEAIAAELQPLTSLGAYHLGMVPTGGVGLPEDGAFKVDPPVPAAEFSPPKPIEGLVLGYFGAEDRPTHCVVVNLDYSNDMETTVVGPGPLEVFDATDQTWRDAGGARATVHLMPGGGKLVRVAR